MDYLKQITEEAFLNEKKYHSSLISYSEYKLSYSDYQRKMSEYFNTHPLNDCKCCPGPVGMSPYFGEWANQNDFINPIKDEKLLMIEQKEKEFKANKISYLDYYSAYVDYLKSLPHDKTPRSKLSEADKIKKPTPPTMQKILTGPMGPRWPGDDRDDAMYLHNLKCDEEEINYQRAMSKYNQEIKKLNE
jgi:hypothetical protein